MNQNKTKTFSIEVSLTDSQAAAFDQTVQGDMPIGRKLSGIATGVLAHVADGGMVIDPITMGRITDLVGEITNCEDLVPHIEKSTGRRDGCLVAEWLIDPTYEPMLRGIAESQGRTVQEIVQDGMNYAMGQGWLYEVTAQPEKVLFAEEDMVAVREILGKERVTGTDIAKFIRENAADPILRGD